MNCASTTAGRLARIQAVTVRLAGAFRSWPRRLVAALAAGGLLAGLPAAPSMAQPGQSAVEEVVVTARRREENLQQVPVAVAVVDADAIASRSLQSIDDVARFAPGLSFSKAFGRATERPVVRGMGNVLAGVQFGVESGAAYFVDGVYYPGDLQGLNLNNLERVEVVKGPQSALFGRNSYAGAINFVTRAPGDEINGEVRLLGAQDGESDLRAAIGGTVIEDTLAISVNARSYQFDGQWQNLVTDQPVGDESTVSLAGTVDWTPNERLLIRLRGQYQEDEDGTRPLFLQPATANNCFPGLRSLASWPASGSDNQFQYYCGAVGPGAIALNDGPAAGATIVRPDVPASGFLPGGVTFFGNAYAGSDGTAFDGVLRETGFASALLEYESDSGYRLTVANAHRAEDLSTGSDSDHSSVNFKFSAGTPGESFEEGFFAISGISLFDDWSLEARVESPQDRPVRWLVGGFYYAQDVLNEDIFFAGPNALESIESLTNRSWFGSLSFDINERLTASIEYRAMEETKDLIELDDGIDFLGRRTWRSDNPRLTLDYRLNDNLLLFTSFAGGAKPGGFNGSSGAAVGVPVYAQEEVDSLEVGFKSTLLGGRATANAALFLNDVTDVQLTTPLAEPGTQNLTSIVTNQGEGRVIGFELDLLLHANDNVTLGASYALADTEFTAGCDEFQWTLTSGGGLWTGNAATSADFTGQGSCSIEGNRFPLSSEHQASAFIDLRAPFRGSMRFFLNLNASYESDKPVQVHNLAFAPAATLVGARFGLEGDNWSVAAFGRNLTDEDAPPMVTRWLAIPYFTFASVNVATAVPGADTASPRAFFGSLRRQRQWGAEVTYRF